MTKADRPQHGPIPTEGAKSPKFSRPQRIIQKLLVTIPRLPQAEGASSLAADNQAMGQFGSRSGFAVCATEGCLPQDAVTFDNRRQTGPSSTFSGQGTRPTAQGAAKIRIPALGWFSQKADLSSAWFREGQSPAMQQRNNKKKTGRELHRGAQKQGRLRLNYGL